MAGPMGFMVSLVGHLFFFFFVGVKALFIVYHVTILRREGSWWLSLPEPRSVKVEAIMFLMPPTSPRIQELFLRFAGSSDAQFSDMRDLPGSLIYLSFYIMSYLCPKQLHSCYYSWKCIFSIQEMNALLIFIWWYDRWWNVIPIILSLWKYRVCN